MHHRHDKINLPIEILRSFVAIQDCGSFTKAATALRLTQPAISAQIKRLQQLVGGEVFSRNGLGIVLTEKGEAVSAYARRILAINDQIMRLAGTGAHTRHIRVGLASAFAASILGEIVSACRSLPQGDRFLFTCGASDDLMKGLAAGYFDLAFVASPDSVPHVQTLSRWSEKLVWICAPDFLLSPGAPIPLLNSPQGLLDQYARVALEDRDLQYTVVFFSAEIAANLTAVRSGLGFYVSPERVVPPDVKIAREYYLPPLPDVAVGLYLREGLDAKRLAPVIDCLKRVLRPGENDNAMASASSESGHRDGRSMLVAGVK
jgi:DNA-binding transcriptional LysR family regulator